MHVCCRKQAHATIFMLQKASACNHFHVAESKRMQPFSCCRKQAHATIFISGGDQPERILKQNKTCIHIHTHIPTYMLQKARSRNYLYWWRLHTCTHAYIHTCIHTYTHTYCRKQAQETIFKLAETKKKEFSSQGAKRPPPDLVTERKKVCICVRMYTVYCTRAYTCVYSCISASSRGHPSSPDFVTAPPDFVGGSPDFVCGASRLCCGVTTFCCGVPRFCLRGL